MAHGQRPSIAIKNNKIGCDIFPIFQNYTAGLAVFDVYFFDTRFIAELCPATDREMFKRACQLSHAPLDRPNAPHLGLPNQT